MMLRFFAASLSILVTTLISLGGVGAVNATGEGNSPDIDLPPPSGQGRVVLILSGMDGTGPYKEYAEKIAGLGYYAVVIDGRDIFSADQKGGDRLQKAITRAFASSNALAGKVAVIGFSAGGGGALAYAERQPDAVSAVIAYYPATSFIAEMSDMKSFVGKFQVPALVFAGGKDTFDNCCLLATATEMETTAKHPSLGSAARAACAASRSAVLPNPACAAD
ncbi:MAG: hypothetical protein E7813_19930 [Bradyrhizobium sp.]|uniref:dienelactone hydrolase family protein n=1 Tax=Bradyrhizobium sp. TaxID=376 RepID=UPI0011F5C0BC|nr:dienelactone hydrolase family protein [Bradyrhizobium sp.]THD62449.1 MAG: hypothetical protein E7813_19930 [Bradyrhizobium sp.]